MDADFWRVLSIVALFLIVILLVCIGSRLGQVVTELRQLTSAVNQLRSSFPDNVTVIRSQEESIKAMR